MICGVDEAGRGPVIGPLIVAGVLVKEDSELIEMRVRDSKKISPERRERLAEKIKKISRYEIIEVPAKEIDSLREEMTLNALEAKLFATVIERLRPTIAYVDSADANAEEFKRKILKELSFSVELISRHGADDIYPVVSAASILAKSRRQKEMRKIEAEIGERIGSGYPADLITMKFLKRWVKKKGSLPPHTRSSWETSIKLLFNMKIKQLGEFKEEE